MKLSDLMNLPLLISISLSLLFSSRILLGNVAEAVADAPIAIADEKKTITVKTERYAVTGTTAEQLIADLNHKGPGDGSGMRFDALTTWKIRPGVNGTPSTCTINLLLPYAKDYQQLSPQLKTAWDEFSLGLEQHELDHANLIAITFKKSNMHSTEESAKEILDSNDRLDTKTNHIREIRQILKSQIAPSTPASVIK